MVRLQSFMEAYGARAMLFELWTQKPALFDLLLLLFDRSEFLAERAIRTPDLVDELEAADGCAARKPPRETLPRPPLRPGRQGSIPLAAPLSRGRIDAHRPARHFGPGRFRAKPGGTFRAGRRLPAIRAGSRLPRAAACRPLPSASSAWASWAAPRSATARTWTFFSWPRPAQKTCPPARPWPPTVMDLLSRPTELGIVFRIDTRLRPDGEKGLLVNTLEACEDYYRRRAALWEIQALTRARPVAGRHDAWRALPASGRRPGQFHPAKRRRRVRPAFVLLRQTAVGAGRLHPGLEGGNRPHAPADDPGTHRARAGSLWPSKPARAG